MGYIDSDKFAERIKVSPAFRNINDGLWLQRVVIDLLNNMPTADVVPKSEVDKLKDEIDRLKYNLKAVIEEIPETKREVAREIFEEIEKLTPKKFTEKSQDFEFGYALAIQQIKNKIAELKKEYTED